MRKVAIVGLGALGSHVALLGRNWDVALSLIDFDRVEAKHTQSQFHTKLGRGKNKAVAMKEALQGLWGLTTTCHTVGVNSTNTNLLLVDLIIDCTDNFKARETIQRFASESEKACVHGCMSADGSLARIVWTEHFVPDKEGVEGEATCEDGRNLPFHGLAAAMIAQTVQRYLEKGVKQSWQVTPFSMIRVS